MRIELDMPKDLEERLRELVLKATYEAFEQKKKRLAASDWMNLKEGALYAGVSHNTFIKFRHLGLRVCEIDGVRRVSKKMIDEFLESNSY